MGFRRESAFSGLPGGRCSPPLASAGLSVYRRCGHEKVSVFLRDISHFAGALASEPWVGLVVLAWAIFRLNRCGRE